MRVFPTRQLAPTRGHRWWSRKRTTALLLRQTQLDQPRGLLGTGQAGALAAALNVALAAIA